VELSPAIAERLIRDHRFGVDMVGIAVRARFKCEYCSADLLASVDAYEWNWEREHVVPLSSGGADSLDNWAMACRVCNQLKGRWDPRSDALDPSVRDDLVAAARRFVQARRAERQSELATVRALVAAELEL
jgi:5-methylcytosine-specific restriction endonuclease McrA